MAGLAMIFDQAEPVSKLIFSEFLETAASFKQLETPDEWASGPSCLAAKLDAPCSLYRGFARDDQTGSWIMAAGTLIDLEDSGSDSSLMPFLHDYLEHGERVFKRMDGQFVLIIFNALEDRVLVLCDPFGMVPIYYGQKGKRFYISTSALAVAKAIQSAPSEFGIRSFILYASTFGDTLWQDVHMLPPSTVLSISREGTHQSVYWSFQIDPDLTALSRYDAVECIVESFSKSIRHSLGKEEKVWVSLTGGLDSRTLAALVNYNQIPFKAYSHGPLDSRDIRIAEQISRTMGWEHEYFALPEDWGIQRVSWFDRVLGETDGLLDVIKMSRTIREQTLKALQHPVSLWGYGGELYRGYYWKQEFWNTGVTKAVDYDRLMDYRVSPSNESILKDAELWKGKLRAEIKHRFQMVGEQEPAWPNTVKLDLIGAALERHACGITIASVMGDQRVILPFDFKENISRIFSVITNGAPTLRCFDSSWNGSILCWPKWKSPMVVLLFLCATRIITSLYPTGWIRAKSCCGSSPSNILEKFPGNAGMQGQMEKRTQQGSGCKILFTSSRIGQYWLLIKWSRLTYLMNMHFETW